MNECLFNVDKQTSIYHIISNNSEKLINKNIIDQKNLFLILILIKKYYYL